MEVIPRGLELNFGNYLPRQSHVQTYNNIYIYLCMYMYMYMYMYITSPPIEKCFQDGTNDI